MTVMHKNRSFRPVGRARPLVQCISPSKDVIKSTLFKAAHIFMVSIGSPYALKAADLLINNKHDEFVEHCKSFNHNDYENIEEMRRDYQVSALLKKANFLNTSYTEDQRDERALEKWVEAERKCITTNDRLRELVYGSETKDLHALSVLSKARDFIKRVLGPAPKIRELNCRFGPGSTYLVKNEIVLPKKYGQKAVLTPNLLPYIDEIRAGLWPCNDIEVIDGNTLSFVPKDATISRPIGIEPDMNIYLQLGLGHALRTRLKLFGIDLDHGQDVNRRLASVAHSHKLSTIDLASASDTVCYMLVMLLLPDDWFELLDAARSATTTYQGKTINLEKFSSMGNGYTFELESLIFYSICRASGSSEFWTVVYGDDIIVDRESVDEVIKNLEFFGFEVNENKSFKDGDFFESCGSDFFKGVNVRPFFWKKADSIVDLYKSINDVSRWCQNGTHEFAYRDSIGHATWSFINFRLQGLGLQHLVPANAGDVGIAADFDHATPQRASHGLEGFTFKAVKWKSNTLNCTRWFSAYLASLDAKVSDTSRPVGGVVVIDDTSRPGSGEIGAFKFWGKTTSGGFAVTPVRGSGGYVATKGHTHEWPNLGPWC